MTVRDDALTTVSWRQLAAGDLIRYWSTRGTLGGMGIYMGFAARSPGWKDRLIGHHVIIGDSGRVDMVNVVETPIFNIQHEIDCYGYRVECGIIQRMDDTEG